MRSRVTIRDSFLPGQTFDKTLVDEMQDMQSIHQHSDNLSLEIKKARNFKEDAHRLKGKSGDYIIYKVEPLINSWKVYSFFPDEITDFRFSASANGRDYKQVKFNRKDYFVGKGEYDYYKPVLYNGAGSGDNATYLKIEYNAEASIGRITRRDQYPAAKLLHPVGCCIDIVDGDIGSPMGRSARRDIGWHFHNPATGRPPALRMV